MRLKITCPSIAGSLMFKFGSGSQTITSQSGMCSRSVHTEWLFHNTDHLVVFVDPCASNSCSNGADCNPMTGVCNCTPGYTGVSCESGKNIT